MKVNILGTEYSIEYKTAEQVAEDMEAGRGEYDGYCSPYSKTIVIARQSSADATANRKIEQRVLRHEIIHAFLHESGLFENSLPVDAWAMNEEMVDWMTLQFPKMLKAFEEVGAIEREKCGKCSKQEPEEKPPKWKITELDWRPGYCKMERAAEEKKPKGKIYIVGYTEKEWGEYKEGNEKVFATREKADSYIKSKGYTIASPYGTYYLEEGIAYNYADDLERSEWIKRLKEYAKRLPNSREEYLEYWLETAHDNSDMKYWIEEHEIDI